MRASTIIAMSAPRCRKNRRRTIWPWLRPSVSFCSMEISATAASVVGVGALRDCGVHQPTLILGSRPA